MKLMKGCVALVVLLLACQVCAARARVADPSYAGFLEVADCNEIEGWAADRNRPNTPITVSIYDGQTLVVSGVPANILRTDVASFLGDNGKHGFQIPTPPALKDTHAHTISVRFETTNVELTNSPKTSAPCVTPPEGTGAQVRLELTLKINNGAGTTKSHLISLNFDAREVSANGTRHEATVTEYRVRAVGLNEPLTSISASPWQPFNGSIPPMSLPERNDFGQRYGERRVLLQVKTAALTSDVSSDTITLDPVLKEYTVHAAADHTHPLIQYAASQGFTFPRTFFQVCAHGSDASSSPDMSQGSASITGGALPCPSSSSVSVADDPKCETRFEYELFGGRELNNFWRIKSVNVSGGDAKFHGVNRYLVKGHVTEPPACCPTGTRANGGVCAPDNLNAPPTVTVGDIVIEGPEADDFVDSANPWKNAFVKSLQLVLPPPNARP